MFFENNFSSTEESGLNYPFYRFLRIFILTKSVFTKLHQNVYMEARWIQK